MSVIDPKSMLSELKVGEVLHRIAVTVPADASIEQVIRTAIKNKSHSVLATDDKLEPLGVVSETDLMCAYYAGIPVASTARNIMQSPPIYCRMEDTLEYALSVMRQKEIHSVFVRGDSNGRETVVLAYPDIVGLLYRYCHRCERNIMARHNSANLLRVREVMTNSVWKLDRSATLLRVMEALSAHRFGAVLITEKGLPVGVISKTDLILAYKSGISSSERADCIMRSPVRSCSQDEELVDAIRKMFSCDVSRFFVYKDTPAHIVGVLSLSDAARAHSGSCRACIPCRIDIL